MLQVTFLPLLRLTDFGNGSKESFSGQAMRCPLKPCPHCHRRRRLSPKTATVAEFGNSRHFRRQIVAEIGDHSRQCGQCTFDSEVSCRVSVVVKKFDCSCNGVAAAVSAIVLALCRQYKYIEYHPLRDSCRFGTTD